MHGFTGLLNRRLSLSACGNPTTRAVPQRIISRPSVEVFTVYLTVRYRNAPTRARILSPVAGPLPFGPRAVTVAGGHPAGPGGPRGLVGGRARRND